MLRLEPNMSLFVKWLGFKQQKKSKRYLVPTLYYKHIEKKNDLILIPKSPPLYIKENRFREIKQLLQVCRASKK